MIWAAGRLAAAITVWRVVREKYVDDVLSGEGVREFGGRWNKKGHPVVYTASSVPLALLEMLVQADPLPRYVALSATLPQGLGYSILEPDALVPNWRAAPAPEALKLMGTAWLEAKASCVLSVPSAVLPLERNYLLNPLHADFSAISFGGPVDIELDERLLRAVGN